MMTTIQMQMQLTGSATVIARVEQGADTVLRYFSEPAASQRAALAAAEGRKSAPKAKHFKHLGLVYGSVNAAGLVALRKDKRVSRVVAPPQLSLVRPVEIRPVEAAAALAVTPWGIDFMRVPTLWDVGLTGDGVTVAHLDTGVDGTHPALGSAIKAFAEFDTFGELVKPPVPAHDSWIHGTHTAATIVGRSVGGVSVGVAPGALLASALVIEGGDVVARVLGGMDWAIDQGARILSMSLGFRGYYPQFLVIVDALRANGVLPVIAAGNEGPGTSRSPGNYIKSLSIGAHDAQGNVASFSSSQRFRRKQDPVVPDAAAPGVGVLSAVPGGWATMSGTSMATPHVAGLAALLMEANPTATIAKIERAIRSTATPNDPDRAGAGLIDAPEALAYI